ncbi:hypothetical protein [Acetobacterium bakii]|uniref:hypothetical protein n=1 Tax=Acetobacterium bakii TaxID=52689 RepID=UPI001364D825|nr:hypothetical protein [Acetobacterium bakii]
MANRLACTIMQPTTIYHCPQDGCGNKPRAAHAKKREPLFFLVNLCYNEKNQ